MALAAPAGAQRLPAPVDPALAVYANAADSVTLPDGRSLHLTCMGEGTPSILLTGSISSIGAEWSIVQRELAKTTRTCSWDRPGFGLSDGSQMPQSVATSADDLAMALGIAGIASPYILVGQSDGSYETLLLADRLADQAAGMVLIEPSFPGQQALTDRIFGPDTQVEDLLIARTTQCASDLRDGTLRSGGADPANCFMLRSNYPQVLRDALSRAASNPLQFDTRLSWWKSAHENSRLAENARRAYGDLPLRVLIRIPAPPKVEPGITAAQVAGWVAWHEEAKRRWQALATLSTRGALIEGDATKGLLLQNQPQVVIDTVEAVVAEARSASNSD